MTKPRCSFARLSLLPALCMAWSVAVAAPPGPGPESMPQWLRQRIAQYGSLPPGEAPTGVWRVDYRGRPAYYEQSPCCDQWNPLYDAEGVVICHPDGGITGGGDGQCPRPLDPAAPRTPVWLNPALRDRDE